MRRDIVHYYEADVVRVYEAYRKAALEKFGKDSNAEPYHTISFGLNYSFKYNMTGGSCNVHLIPHNTGAAVDVRYSIAQLMGARYGAYDDELTKYVVGILGVPAQKLEMDVERFLDPNNRVTEAPAPAYTPAPAQTPVFTPAPAPAKAPAPVKRSFCVKCGTKIDDGDLFCGNCGAKL